LPVYVPRAFFGAGNASIKLDELSYAHRIILYISFLVPLLIWLAFRKKDKEIKHFALLFLSLGTLTSFLNGYNFATLANPLAWPLHLCNTAMFIMPITLIFKSEKVFYFTYFINVLGAFLAMVMPNYKSITVFAPGFITFYINHYIAFFLPFLIVSLGVYKKPKMREFKYSIVAFTVYFVLIIFINTWFSNYGSVDYFFLNSDFIVSKLGRWAEATRNWVVQWQMFGLSFKIYPIYQTLFYLVYFGAAFGVWFIYEQFYSFVVMISDMVTKNKILKQNEYLYFANKKGDRNMPSDKTDIVIKKASKKYAKNSKYALDSVDLTVKGGEIFGFLGPNGSGKSTLIKSIVGIQPLTSGSIEICGFDTEKEAIKSKNLVGFVPDHYALYEKLTAREYVNYIADLYGVSKQDRDERIEQYTESLNIKHAFDQKMNTFSHGMKQKITIISALVHDPKLLILDEPLTGLDPNTIYQVKEVMKNHARKGNIVFFSSHIIDIVEKLCDRIAIIKEGVIIKEVTLKELEKKNIDLERFYLDAIAQKN
jgi:ABC-2 type transport system ATP-binding protein